MLYHFSTSSRFDSSQKGFTLLETLIAIAVLTLAIIGPFQIVQGVLTSAYNARDEIVASGLAQEGVEYVREVRDSNYLYNARYGSGSVTWLNGFDGTGGPNCYTAACVVDPYYYPTSVPFSAGSSIISCGGASCASRPLYLDSSSYRYTQQTGGWQPSLRARLRSRSFPRAKHW